MKLILAVVACLLLSVVPAPAQGNFALLFDGVVLTGNAHFPNYSGQLEKLEAKNPIIPHVEVRFNQDGRVTLGLSYGRWTLDSPARHFTELSDPT